MFSILISLFYHFPYSLGYVIIDLTKSYIQMYQRLIPMLRFSAFGRPSILFYLFIIGLPILTYVLSTSVFCCLIIRL